MVGRGPGLDERHLPERRKLEVPVVLTTGDEIRCGNARLTVNLTADVFPSLTQKITEK
jgi:hypothetical protein